MQKLLLTIHGVSCAACVQNIEKSLKKQHLIEDIQINLITKTALITPAQQNPQVKSQESATTQGGKIQEEQIQADKIIEAIKKLGYKPALHNPHNQQASFAPQIKNPSQVSGFSLGASPAKIHSLSPAKLTQQPAQPAASLAKFTAFAPINITPKSLESTPPDSARQIAEQAMQIAPESKHPLARAIDKLNELNDRLLTTPVRLALSALCAGVVLYLSMLPMFFDSILVAPFDDMRVNFSAQLLCSLISMHMAREYYFKGFAALFAKTPTMDSLIAISTSAAFAYSVYVFWLGHGGHWYFESVCVIIFFILLGKSLESSAKDKTTAVINALLQRNLPQVLRLDSRLLQSSAQPVESTISSQDIAIGDRLRILPGQMIPADGVVEEGEGDVDESMLTGESLPVYKRAGDRLCAGSLNTNRALIMRATSTSAQSTLGALQALALEAMSSKPSLARLADKIAAVFVPAVILIALMAFGLWAWLEGVAFGFSIFISVLVISCPCALGLATPMAVMIGTALANKHGIFVRQAQSFESLRKLSHVVFDKTGTLTQSTLEVVWVQSYDKGAMSENEILALAAGLEKGSEHIIAKAILQKAQETLPGENLPEFGGFDALAGVGMQASLKQDSREYRIGSKEMFQNHTQVQHKALQDFWQIPGHEQHICVYLGRESSGKSGDSSQDPYSKSSYEILGVIFLADSLRPHAQATINALKARGITPHILSGDGESNTAQVANTLGIARYKSHASPQDKLAYIHALQQRGEVVMMVGDGVNDVGALMAADISLSFSHASDVSKNAADIIVYHDDIARLDTLLRLSGDITRNIKENLFFAFVYNVICIPLACGVAYYPAGILLNPMIAAFAMSASSICVVLNSQRLWRFGDKG